MKRWKYRIPSISALVAFESAGRFLNFSRAAEELHTSQSAISRHITELEQQLSVKLFIRCKKKHRMTEAGEQLYRAVVSGLDNIQSTINSIKTSSSSNELTIGCTHEISHLYLMPRFETLRDKLGRRAQIRIVSSEYEAKNETTDSRIDLAFSYGLPGKQVETAALLIYEAVCPVCSPEFLKSHQACLSGPVESWAGLPFLQLSKQNKGWASWNDWFTSSGSPQEAVSYSDYDDYVYLLEAAAAGRGLALGWRGLIERYIQAGRLVKVRESFVETNHALYAYLTPSGQKKPLAMNSLKILSGFSADHSEC